MKTFSNALLRRRIRVGATVMIPLMAMSLSGGCGGDAAEPDASDPVAAPTTAPADDSGTTAVTDFGSLDAESGLLPPATLKDMAESFPIHAAALGGTLSTLQDATAAHAEQLNESITGSIDISGLMLMRPTPLICAAAIGWKEGVEHLIEAGADVNQPDGFGRSALEWAVGRTDCIECARLLLDAEADPNQRNLFDSTPLHQAAWNRRDVALEMVQLLVERGAVAGDPRSLAITPLYAAVEAGNMEVARFLIELEPTHVNLMTREGRTPLLLAAEIGHDSIAIELINAGADLAFTAPGRGESVLHMLASRDDEPDAAVLQRLLEEGINVNATDVQGRTPLMMLAGTGHGAMADALLAAGADPWQADGFGTHALEFSAGLDDEPVSIALAEAMAADANVADREDRIRAMVKPLLDGIRGQQWQERLDTLFAGGPLLED